MNWLLISYVVLHGILFVISISDNKAQGKTMVEWARDNWGVYILLPIGSILLIVN